MTQQPLTIYPDDLFLVSYPKSGNTWMRHLFGYYLTGDESANVSAIVPGIHGMREDVDALKRPRYIKSHRPFSGNYPRVIYIVRDGRDVAISYFHFLNRSRESQQELSFSDFLMQFNSGRIDGFSAWSNHVNSWLDHASSNRLLLVRYEDLKADTLKELIRCLEFAQLSVDLDRAKFAVETSRFDRLQTKEIKTLETQGSQKSLFFRKGEAGEWKSLFTEEMLKTFVARHGSALERLGYIEPRNAEAENIFQPISQHLEAVIGWQEERYFTLKQQLETTQHQLEAMEAEKLAIQPSPSWPLKDSWNHLKKGLKALFKQS